jgi:hypothetical protein
MSLHAPARSGDDLSSSNIGDLGGDKEPYKLGEIEWTGNGKEKGRELKKKKVFLTRHMPMLGQDIDVHRCRNRVWSRAIGRTETGAFHPSNEPMQRKGNLNWRC